MKQQQGESCVRYRTGNSVPALYVDDIEDGVVVTHDGCEDFETRNTVPFGEPVLCVNCKVEMHYEHWYEW